MKLTLVASLEISSGLDVSGKVDGFFSIFPQIIVFQLFLRTLKMIRSQMAFRVP